MNFLIPWNWKAIIYVVLLWLNLYACWNNLGKFCQIFDTTKLEYNNKSSVVVNTIICMLLYNSIDACIQIIKSKCKYLSTWENLLEFLCKDHIIKNFEFGCSSQRNNIDILDQIWYYIWISFMTWRFPIFDACMH